MNIIIQPLGGLCNRMRAIVGAASLAQKMGKGLTVLWTQDSTLNARFDELFEPIPYKVVELKLNSWQYKALFHWYKDVRRCMLLDDQWISKYARKKEYVGWSDKIEGKNLFLQTNLDILLDGDYSVFMAKPSVVETMNSVRCDKNTIGLHIRRTDNLKAIQYSPTSLFFEKVKEELDTNPQVRFYLATDDPQEERAFVEKFGNCILIHRKHSLNRNNPVAIKDALVDLYNLSHCSKIFGSYWSSFSDTAALWTGIEKIELKSYEE